MMQTVPELPNITSEDRHWLEAKAQASGSEIIWDPHFKDFLSDVFCSEIEVQVWDKAPLIEVIRDFLSACPDRPRLEFGRYAVFSGAPSFGAGSRGLLWFDCSAPATRAVFAALVRRERRFYCLEIHLSRLASTPVLSPQFLAAMHFWLRLHNAGEVVTIDLYDSSGYVYSLDPTHCGLEQERRKLRQLRAQRGAA